MDLSQAVCTVAPEWWGAADEILARPGLAMQGCAICPLAGAQCLTLIGRGGPVTLEDVGHMVASGLSGPPLVEAVNTYAAAAPRPRKPCGTEAAYTRHIRAGEVPCPACSAAKAKAVRRRDTDEARERRNEIRREARQGVAA